MAVCPACGGTSPAGHRFCTSCGRALPSESSGASVVPSWLSTDWPLAALGMLIVAAALAAASAAYGAVVALLATQHPRALASGAVVGVFGAFAAFGAASGASIARGAAPVGFSAAFLPLPWMGAACAAAWAAMRFAWPRLPTSTERRVAFAGKLAGCVSVLAVLAGAVMTFPSAPFGFSARVAAAEAGVYAFGIVAITGVVFCMRRGALALPSRISAWPAVADGALAFGWLAAACVPVVVASAIVSSDSPTERVLVLFALPVLGANAALSAAVLAMGGSVAVAPPSVVDISRFGLPGLAGGHVSLLHAPGGESAPAPLFAVLIVPVGLIAWTVYRRLERDPAPSEQAAVRVGFQSAIGFAAAAWIGALAGRIAFSGLAEGIERVQGVIFMRPSAGGALGLALVWGVAGGVGTALLWARRRHVPWEVAAAGRACPSCGAVNAGSASFCGSCGTALETGDATA